MKNILTVFLIFIFGYCYSQNNELKGIVEFNLLDLQYKDSIHFYNTPNLDDKYISIFDISERDRIYHYSNNQGDQGRLSGIKKNLVEFQPLYFYSDYNILNPICVEITDDFYKIKISKGVYKYLDKSSNYLQFRSFEYLFENKEILVDKSNIYYDKPDLNAMKVVFDDRLTYEVLTVSIDWLKLRSLPEMSLNDFDENEDKNDLIYEGWIKWKDGETVFIHFLFRP